jgi:hypothetical protein
MEKQAFVGKFLNPNMLSRAGQIAASDTAALKAFDKAMRGAAKSGKPSAASKALQGYGKYFMAPAHTASKMAYGKKADMAKLMALFAGSGATLRYGGEFARPLYNSLHGIARNINKGVTDKALKGSWANPDSTINLIKPGMAITSKPALMLDDALGGIMNLADASPILPTLLLPAAIYGGVRGGSAIFSRLAQGRRLKLLRQGIAPKAYRSHAQRYGFK